MKYGVVLITIVFLSAGCWLLDTVPDSLSASKGEFTDYISLSWSEPYPADKTLAVDYYTLQRSTDGITYSFLDITSSLCYDDTPVDPGRTYYYKVSAHYTNGLNSDDSNPDSGFAMDAATLALGTSYQAHHVTTTSDIVTHYNNVAWFEVILQQGWTYHFRTYSAGTDVDTVICLYNATDIENEKAIADDGGTNTFSLLDWTCKKSGTYYLRITANSTDTFNISGWY